MLKQPHYRPIQKSPNDISNPRVKFSQQTTASAELQYVTLAGCRGAQVAIRATEVFEKTQVIRLISVNKPARSKCESGGFPVALALCIPDQPASADARLLGRVGA
ncbi:hypothetical protein SKAU_G00175220 [Synaphobranchus kaupii]|uniref:Uncharacterized protein n=1 Tax=Synaphobranchus kaupii TaxID=118154 RepID=A0A9Q1FL50_SYNKA|nr:hypothetical protein SKAU_G00175220 [Synaphobranchus kaupii]